MNEQKLESLIELASLLAKQKDFQEVLRLVTQKSSEFLDCDTALIMMINPRTHQTVKTIFSEGEKKENLQYHFLHENISGWVIKNNQSFLSNDIQLDQRFRKNLFNKLPVKSAICVPLQIEGIIIGTLLLFNQKEKKNFSDSSLLFLEKYAAITAPFLRNAQKIKEYFDAPLPQKMLQEKYQPLGLLGKSKIFIDLLRSIDAAAKCDVRVTLEGESGTGKELIAKAIHHLSERNNHKFVAIDCGAIPANLIESELFGHMKGAYTGASSARTGLIETANHGTFFMDEIANLPLDMQAKLLRVLQENEIRPLGSNNSKEINVRIISATSTQLKKQVEARKFREDLFYRLHVYPISVPSLNDRYEDIPHLAHFFLKKFSDQQKKNIEFFHEDVLDFMQQKNWPGNIRELENFVERIVTLAPAEAKIINQNHLPKEFRKQIKKSVPAGNQAITFNSLNEQVEQYEEHLIRDALEKNDWNQSKAARSLKISEQTIRYKMNKLNIKNRDLI